jgi:hypothetical protein
MSEPTFICPNCKTEIRLKESLAAPLIEPTRRYYEKRLALKDTDVAKERLINLQQTKIIMVYQNLTGPRKPEEQI